jgi:hypothetical protein
MEYVEILRARRHLIWFTAILAASFLLTLITALTGHLQTRGHMTMGSIPVPYLEGICFFGALIIASFVAPGLHAEHTTLALTWTRPMPRSTIAWRFIAVDLAAMLIGALIVAIVILGQMLVVGILGYVSFNAGDFFVTLIEATGAALMWYGLIMVASVRIPERAGMIAGFSWIVFSVISVLAYTPIFWPIVHDLFAILNLFNPLAYFGGGGHAGGASVSIDASSGAAGTLPGPQYGELITSPIAKTIVSYVIAAAALAATVRLWSTREI